ncbi:hypothetical protein [Haloterrigena salifodinae]|uniref:hypothetical protein n=1 Tax=Haloterrigena salifodinae TaxID=2675099 RepID=UPI000F89BE07|nr:hypothetical protein [Haloterrigena salifodinae]
MPVASLCNFPTRTVSSVEYREEEFTLDTGDDRISVRRTGNEREKPIEFREEDISLPFRSAGDSG